MINKLAQEIHANAKSKGWYDEEKNIGEMLCLIHSEVSEALEADRNDNYSRADEITLGGLADKNYGASYFDDDTFHNAFVRKVKDSFEDELADIVIRVFDMAAYKGIDLEKHIQAKMRYNKLRPHKHGGKKY